MTRRDEGRNFSPTHRIRHGREVLIVQLDAAAGLRDAEGVAYTRDEWESAGVADYEVVAGEWLFQGEPFSGRVEPLGKDEMDSLRPKTTTTRTTSKGRTETMKSNGSTTVSAATMIANTKAALNAQAEALEREAHQLRQAADALSAPPQKETDRPLHWTQRPGAKARMSALQKAAWRVRRVKAATEATNTH